MPDTDHCATCGGELEYVLYPGEESYYWRHISAEDTLVPHAARPESAPRY